MASPQPPRQRPSLPGRPEDSGRAGLASVGPDTGRRRPADRYPDQPAGGRTLPAPPGGRSRTLPAPGFPSAGGRARVTARTARIGPAPASTLPGRPASVSPAPVSNGQPGPARPMQIPHAQPCVWNLHRAASPNGPAPYPPRQRATRPRTARTSPPAAPRPSRRGYRMASASPPRSPVSNIPAARTAPRRPTTGPPAPKPPRTAPTYPPGAPGQSRGARIGPDQRRASVYAPRPRQSRMS